jgi:hypothetical protein
MHMVFVDESGDPGFPSDGDWPSFGGSRFFTRVGVIIHGWKWRAWNERLLDFKKRNGLLWNDEIKASYIKKGKGCFVGWSEKKRSLFFENLIELIGLNEDITLIGISIEKMKIDTSRSDRLVKPQIRSMELLLERFNQFLGEQRDKTGIAILDATKESNDDNIRYFQSYLQVHSKYLRPLHIVESTFFAKSHTSSMIQVSDVCTHVFYREMVQEKTKEFQMIYPRFWRMKGRVKGFGVKSWPA